VIDAGYFPKRIKARPDGINAPQVREICSVSNCISDGPENWIQAWLHNEMGWFNWIVHALSVVPRERESEFRLFAYRVHPVKFTPSGLVPIVTPSDVQPEPVTDEFRSLGFDCANDSNCGVLGLECSPLSCNYMALEMETNEHCLFTSLDHAIRGAERFAAEQPEPGDYYIVEVLERK
jgi:hypothetical protein